jgi:hypothetical protein
MFWSVSHELASRQIRKARAAAAEFLLCAWTLNAYIPPMNWLTRQEQYVLTVALALLLVGLAVKTYRTSHPSAAGAAPAQQAATNAVATVNKQ